MKIKVTNNRPNKPGKYIFVGRFTKTPEIITVVQYPAKFKYGTNCDVYLGVAESCGSSIEHFNGWFSDLIEDIIFD